MKLKDMGILVEREWWIDEEGIGYIVDLALPAEECNLSSRRAEFCRMICAAGTYLGCGPSLGY